MILDYSTLPFDADGNPETPELFLQTLSGRTLGLVSGAYNLRPHIKFAEPSELEFDLPSVLPTEHGLIENPIYRRVTGEKLIWTEHYGVYVTMNPETTSDGMKEIKHVKCYSIEYTFYNKRFFLEEGSYKFYNQTNRFDPNTIIGRILEIDPTWNIGYISPDVAASYRYLDQYDDYLMPFIQDAASKSYRCVFCFDPYGSALAPSKTIHVYSVDEETVGIPIYLDFENLMSELKIEEKTDELKTAIRPLGSDDLNIIAVNPTGEQWLYDLSYFIANGDITSTLSDRWYEWQAAILNRQMEHSTLVEQKVSERMQEFLLQAEITELEGERALLASAQNVTIQAIANEGGGTGNVSGIKSTDIDWESETDQNRKLKKLYNAIAAKDKEIEAKEQELTAAQQKRDAIDQRISKIANALSMKNYFSAEEYAELLPYIIQNDAVEESFVASDLEEASAAKALSLAGCTLDISGSAITTTRQSNGRDISSIVGGSCSVSSGGDALLRFDVIRGTVEELAGGEYVCSIYAGAITSGDAAAESGTISFSCHGACTSTASTCAIAPSDGTLYLTTNVSEYQTFSVQKELFDYGVSVLNELATPTYEFSIESGNFLFEQRFAAFRNVMALGKHIYLNIGDEVITPYAIEMEFSFEERSRFNLIFSNRFKRHDPVNTMKDMMDRAYSSSRSLDVSKYLTNQAVEQASSVSKFMSDSLDAAVNAVKSGGGKVLIDDAGIHVGYDSNEQIRITDSMIAFTQDGWQTAKMALGHFQSAEVGNYFGINAEVIGGKLIVGNDLVIENVNSDGVMQFRVDSSGAWLKNGTFVWQGNKGGQIVIDPKYGIIGGKSVFQIGANGTIEPAYIKNGSIEKDEKNMPKHSNFYLDINSGEAFFRGAVFAERGEFTGTIHATAGSFDGMTINNATLTNATIGTSDNDHATLGYAEIRNAHIYDAIIDNASIKNGTIGSGVVIEGGAATISDAIKVTSGGISGWMGVMTGEDDNGTTTGVGFSYGENAENYVIVTTSGVRLQAGANSLYVTSNGVSANIGGTITKLA